MLWRAERIFAGRTVVCVAGGPSLSLSQVRAIGIARASDLVRVVAVNDAVYPCWFADLLYACDREWWEHHDGVAGFEGRRVTLKHQNLVPYDGADWLLSTGLAGLESDPGGLRTGGNSGYQALNLIAHLGAATILMVGYDMHQATHWFGDHPEPVRRSPPHMPTLASHFDSIAQPLADLGIRVVNCNPGSAITAFPKGDLMTELKRLEDKRPKPAPVDKAAVYVHRQMAAGQGGYKTR